MNSYSKIATRCDRNRSAKSSAVSFVLYVRDLTLQSNWRSTSAASAESVAAAVWEDMSLGVRNDGLPLKHIEGQRS
jgi:hypothetical protein